MLLGIYHLLSKGRIPLNFKGYAPNLWKVFSKNGNASLMCRLKAITILIYHDIQS